MLSEDSFYYAIENTQVILAPQQRIATFGSTSFHFHLVTEMMDRVDEGWEVCLLKFTVDLINQSAGGNMGDFRKRGLI